MHCALCIKLTFFGFKNLDYFLAVIKVVFHTLDFLVVLMSFAGYHHDVATLRKLASHLDGLTAVGDG